MVIKGFWSFIDETIYSIADILLKILPASKQEKQAFFMTGNDCIIKGVDMQSITIMRSSSS
jgi:hypothetical protein